MSFSAFSLFNALSPKEWGSRRIANGLAYGADPRQVLDIFAPRGRQSGLPVIFFVYGGGWTDGDRGNYEFAGRALAALGYIVVVPDYRLVPAVEFPAFLRDLALAFAFTVKTIAALGGDPGRIALMGHSAGAYNVAMLALDPRWLDPGLGQSIKALVGLSGPYDFLPFDGPISIRVFGAVPDPKLTQPLQHAGPDAPPTFLGHGTEDKTVLPSNSKALAARLRNTGAPVTERYYEGLSHAMPLLALGRLLRSRAPVLSDVAAFLAGVFKPLT